MVPETGLPQGAPRALFYTLLSPRCAPRAALSALRSPRYALRAALSVSHWRNGGKYRGILKSRIRCISDGISGRKKTFGVLFWTKKLGYIRGGIFFAPKFGAKKVRTFFLGQKRRIFLGVKKNLGYMWGKIFFRAKIWGKKSEDFFF